jgi:predicted oxidoreductase (fatty acid repression mutant protein)
MTGSGAIVLDETRLFPLTAPSPSDGLLSLLERRRSIRRLRPGPFSDASLNRIVEAIRLTPSAFNLPPWHIVIVRDELAAFWQLAEQAVRERLDGDRQGRYLDRIGGFSASVAVALVYEEVAIRDQLANAWQISLEQAGAFVEQGLGMAQLALWLAVTAEDLVASLQHWEWLLEGPLAEFVGLSSDQFRLKAILPIGHADEEPRPADRIQIDQIVSRDRFGGRRADGW